MAHVPFVTRHPTITYESREEGTMAAEDSAIRRLEAAIAALNVRMRGAAGDLDYESYLHEKRTLERALHSLKQRQQQTK